MFSVPTARARVVLSDDDERWLTITEAAFYLNTSEQTIRRRLKDGKLPAEKIDGMIRIRRSEIDRYMESR